MFIYLFLLIFISSCDSNITTNEYVIDSTFHDTSVENLLELEYPLQTELKSGIINEKIINQSIKYIGDITHIINDTMEFGKLYPVNLVISYKTPIDIIANDIKSFRDVNNLNTQKILITPLMKAKLLDPTGNSFKITPVTDSIQQVDMEDGTYTVWQWKVIPIKGGNNELVLNVDMIIGNNKKSLKIYNDTIHVKVKPIDKISDWIERNWQYITYIISVLGIAIGWLYKEQLVTHFKKSK